MRNLLDNAIRHTPPGGAVEVDVRPDDGAAEVSVRDGCGGIPDADLDRVFDLAYRGDAARTPGADRAGPAWAWPSPGGWSRPTDGDIAVRNEDDGCRFTVRLPAGVNGVGMPTAPEARAGGNGSGRNPLAGRRRDHVAHVAEPAAAHHHGVEARAGAHGLGQVEHGPRACPTRR